MTGIADHPVRRFALGPVPLTIVSDGPLALGRIEDSFVGVAPETLHAAMRRLGFEPEPLVFQQNVLVADLGSERVVFDTGMGGSKMFGPAAGQLQAGLAAAGIAPGSVTAVCISHGHSDHIWGLAAGGRPAFPAARVILSARTLADWEELAEGAVPGLPAGYVELCRETLEAVRGRLEICAPDGEPIPGLRIVPTPGHTLGHVSYRLGAGPDTLFVSADIVHHPALHLEHPRLEFLFDADRTLAVETRVAWLARLADEGILVFSYHFPFPGLGRIRRQDGDRYAWDPA